MNGKAEHPTNHDTHDGIQAELNRFAEDKRMRGSALNPG